MTELPDSPPKPPADVAVDIAQVHAQSGQDQAELARLQQEVVEAQMRLGVGQGAQLHEAKQQLIAAMLQTREEVQNTERALGESAGRQQQLDELFAFSRDAMAKIDDAGVVRRINKRAEELFGWTPAELVGQPAQGLLAPESRVPFAALLGERRGAAQPVDATKPWPSLQALRKDGGTFPASVGMRVADEAGESVVIAVFDDITEREELVEALQQSAARYRDTLDNLIEGCQIVDADWRCRYVNPVAARHANRSPQSLVGRRLAQVHPGIENTEVFAMSQGCMADRLPRNAEVDAVFPGGLRGRFQVSVCPAEDGILIFSVDVTRQRRAEDQVRASNADLERRVAERTAELERAREAADEANRAKSVFLATMSHEIRTPMNGVIGMVEVLSHSELPEPHAEAVRTIRRSAFTLLGIIDDILDFSKIEAGRLELEDEPLVLAEAIESVGDTLLPMAADRHVDLRLFVSPRIPRVIRADPVRLRQVLINLISNAIKFGAGRPARHGRVAVLAEMSEAAVPTLRLRVVDDGIGMTPATLAVLFTPFSQADPSTTRHFGGTGLGLTICRRLVTLMRGEIDVTSAPGVGSTFVVTLPVQAVDEPQAAGLVRLDDCACVIVGADEADDDVRAYLESAGARVTRLADLAAAVAAARELPQAVFIHRMAREQWSLEPLREAFPSDGGAAHVLIEPDRRDAARQLSPRLVAMGGRLLRGAVLLRAVSVAAGLLPADLLHDLGPRDLPDPPARPLTVEEARAQGRLLLIAEDDEVNQAVILRQIEILGYAAEVAGNGELALEMWRGGDYALLLTDLHMPSLDGYALAQAIRHGESARPPARRGRMPILALTANALRGEANRAFAAGMDEYLTKPLQLRMLADALRKWLPPEAPDAPQSPPITAGPSPTP